MNVQRLLAIFVFLLETNSFADGPKKFGAALKGQKPMSLSSVIEFADKYAGKTVLVEGKVRANCTKKGCWMELASGLDKAAAGCRVTFKDYGFFVPLDAKGSTARVEGEVAVRVLSVGEVEHMEAEGGSFKKLPDGTAREVRIVATGVELRR